MNYSIAKSVMPSELQPNSIVLTRISMAALFFFVIDSVRKEHYLVPVADKWRIFFCGFFGVALNQLFLYKGLSITAPINSALIMATIPILILLLSALFLKNAPSWKQYLGVFISASGAYYLIVYSGKGLGNRSLEGDVLILLNSLSYAIFMVIAKPVLEKYDALFVTKWMFAGAALVVLPFTLNDTLHDHWESLSSNGWMAYAYIIVFATFFNYYIGNATLQWISPVTAGSYIYLQPFLASVFAVAVGQDIFSHEKIISGVLILSGLILTSRLFNKPVA